LKSFRLLLPAIPIAFLLLACQPSLFAQKGEVWATTWAASPSQLVDAVAKVPKFQTLFHPEPVQTIREIVHTSIGGDKVRIRFTNAFGSEPLEIVTAHVAVRDKRDAIVPATDQHLVFGGTSIVIVPPGAIVLSDPVNLRFAPHSDLAITLVTKGRNGTSTLHALALQTSYTAEGDQAAATSLTSPSDISSWPFLSEIEVADATEKASVVIALGDSITDGALTHANTNRRWPDILSERLAQSGLNIGVGNAGIAGNRLLHDGEGPFAAAFGVSALARLDRDAIAMAAVKYMIVSIGLNDIGQPGSNGVSADSAVSANQIEQALLQIVARAHVHGIRVMGATLTPFAAAKAPGYFSEEKEKKREAVNEWIRTAGAFDAVADFDKAVRDSQHPLLFDPQFDGGDGLHPSAAGMQALADCIPLGFFH
jgi:lysophospholipase L1-like esterase